MLSSILTAIAVLLRIFSNPFSNLFQKKLTSKNNHPLIVNFLTYLLLSILCILIAQKFHWQDLPQQFWIYSILGGITGALGNGFLVKALYKGDLFVLGPVNAYKSVVGIIVAIFLLREIPNIWGILGIALIVYGSYFVLDTTEEGFSLALLKRIDIQYRVWAMILSAIEAVFIKKVILASSPAIAFFSWCWFGAVFSLVLLFIYRLDLKKEILKVGKIHLPDYFFLIICVGTMQFTTIITFKHLPVGYALSLFQLSAIVSVFLGHRYFKEQEIRKKLMGTIIMIIGSILIVIFKNY